MFSPVVAISVASSRWTEVNNQVNNLLITHTLVPVLTKGLRCSQVNFSCDKSHDRHGKMDGAAAAWVSLIDFGFSQQSMFWSWHMCLNEAAPSIKVRGRAALCPSTAANQCNKTECFPGLMRPLCQNERGRQGRRGKGNFFLCCRRCFRFDSDGRRWHVRVKKNTLIT